MPYCENCGYKVSNSDRFCENCGHSLPLDEKADMDDNLTTSYDVPMHLFSNPDWKTEWKNFADKHKDATCGIVLTNTHDCPVHLLHSFKRNLKRYIASRASDNVFYCLLNTETQAVKPIRRNTQLTDVGFVVDILQEVSRVAIPHCIMIVGDRDAVPSIQWDNALHDPNVPYCDQDKYVDSDFPYVKLDVKSPFESTAFKLSIAVGRIPSEAATGFPEAQQYFENATYHNSKSHSINPLVLTAREWKQASKLSYEGIPSDFHSCPNDSFIPNPDMKLLDNNSNHNLLCFNLHGCHDGYVGPNDYWVNGDGDRAYSPGTLPASPDVSYVISTEACYGAKPYIRNTHKQSTLMTALQNRCIGFLGSTQIAYGITDYCIEYRDGKPMAADIMSGTFAKYVNQGYSIGYAYIRAVKAISADARQYASRFLSEEIKTLCSFALYGDPTLTLIGNNQQKSVTFPEQSKQLHIDMPDVKRAVEMRIAKVSEEIARRVNLHVKTNYAEFADATPTYYKVKHFDGYKASYAKSNDDRTQILNLYFGDDGQIVRTYTTK